MGTLTIRLPDDKRERVRALAERKKMSINKWIEEMSTLTLDEFDSEARFRAFAASGDARRGLALLKKLRDRAGTAQRCGGAAATSNQEGLHQGQAGARRHLPAVR